MFSRRAASPREGVSRVTLLSCPEGVFGGSGSGAEGKEARAFVIGTSESLLSISMMR